MDKPEKTEPQEITALKRTDQLLQILCDEEMFPGMDNVNTSRVLQLYEALMAKESLREDLIDSLKDFFNVDKTTQEIIFSLGDDLIMNSADLDADPDKADEIRSELSDLFEETVSNLSNVLESLYQKAA